MCTVSFIPANEKFYLCANRDEHILRKTAVPPELYAGKTGSLIYPKDADAGGSWISLHQNGNAAVLLNGAFEKHIPDKPYRLSRGLIFLDIVDTIKPTTEFNNINLHSIEPFTLIIFENTDLFQCRWDGHQKHIEQLNSKLPFIWSSVTLYDVDVIKKREAWFAQWLIKNPAPNLDDIIAFHRFTGEGDSNNDLMMNRDGKLLTVSITGMELQKNRGLMKYLDLQNEQTSEKEIPLGSVAHPSYHKNC